MQVVSVIFHPLLMATYATTIFYVVYPAIFSPVLPEFIPYLILAIFTTTAVIPAVSIIFLKLTKHITNLDVTKREERLLPFISICCFYAFTAYMLHDRLHVPWPITAMVILSTVLIVVFGIISFKTKVSIHAGASWSLCGIFSSASLQLEFASIPVLVLLFLMAGVTSASRLYLQRHTESEVWLGTFIGFLFSLIVSFFFY